MKQKEDDHHNRRYLRREFSYSKFEQALILPEDVVKEKNQRQCQQWCSDH